MNIALIAHDAKKELMVQFCIAYCGILSRHNICATGTTGKMVAEATGLNITRYMSGSQGGDQQISARIACDEIDLLLFFRDPMTVKAHEPNESDMFRLCDMRNIPVATNIATAEVLIHGLERGDRLAQHRQPRESVRIPLPGRIHQGTAAVRPSGRMRF